MCMPKHAKSAVVGAVMELWSILPSSGISVQITVKTSWKCFITAFRAVIDVMKNKGSFWLDIKVLAGEGHLGVSLIYMKNVMLWSRKAPPGKKCPLSINYD